MNKIVEVTGLGDVLRPHETPQFGNRRLVRMIPTPLGSRPAIWTSGYETLEVFQDGAAPERARKCVVLISPGSNTEKPDTAVITIPSTAIDLFPMVPVEW